MSDTSGPTPAQAQRAVGEMLATFTTLGVEALRSRLRAAGNTEAQVDQMCAALAEDWASLHARTERHGWDWPALCVDLQRRGVAATDAALIATSIISARDRTRQN